MLLDFGMVYLGEQYLWRIGKIETVWTIADTAALKEKITPNTSKISKPSFF
ncbi:MAG: hypothetical protein IJY06_00655 [Oscillospiraceae bacterium]|nr:hypothetical protein [Oscillospiraceae bacterium]